MDKLRKVLQRKKLSYYRLDSDNEIEGRFGELSTAWAWRKPQVKYKDHPFQSSIQERTSDEIYGHEISHSDLERLREAMAWSPDVTTRMVATHRCRNRSINQTSYNDVNNTSQLTNGSRHEGCLTMIDIEEENRKNSFIAKQSNLNILDQEQDFNKTSIIRNTTPSSDTSTELVSNEPLVTSGSNSLLKTQNTSCCGNKQNDLHSVFNGLTVPLQGQPMCHLEGRLGLDIYDEWERALDKEADARKPQRRVFVSLALRCKERGAAESRLNRLNASSHQQELYGEISNQSSAHYSVAQRYTTEETYTDNTLVFYPIVYQQLLFAKHSRRSVWKSDVNNRATFLSRDELYAEGSANAYCVPY